MSERITSEQVQSDVESYALRASPDGRRRVIREALDKARREGGEDAQAEVARLREALAASEARAASEGAAWVIARCKEALKLPACARNVRERQALGDVLAYTSAAKGAGR